MPKRICDACGKEKDVYGGKVCSKGHFMCHGCYIIGGKHKMPVVWNTFEIGENHIF